MPPTAAQSGESIREELLQAIEVGDFRRLKQMLDRQRAKAALQGLPPRGEGERAANGLLRLLNEVVLERWWFFEREINAVKVIFLLGATWRQNTL